MAEMQSKLEECIAALAAMDFVSNIIALLDLGITFSPFTMELVVLIVASHRSTTRHVHLGPIDFPNRACRAQEGSPSLRHHQLHHPYSISDPYLPRPPVDINGAVPLAARIVFVEAEGRNKGSIYIGV
ncbi:hypothetical protein CC1G_10594 [Coprinopsis cinerea okayama7|uniref:Uncharacterized protein n=1 Tax=Coprinopsis cinerea (strain Okayama-7 / 130 / ATCC MYA-4618 / FGSC 9003) TaxID=240176 RepID=A8P8M7_COPC7|nr:hypothetical protein CC1G_10594 [Coprinopsis cinerea okayama7\|eukprot:XP_001839601.1 hypothetical protein CC1G_10594 [Coprinopsis cinerea okayama7\